MTILLDHMGAVETLKGLRRVVDVRGPLRRGYIVPTVRGMVRDLQIQGHGRMLQVILLVHEHCLLGVFG